MKTLDYYINIISPNTFVEFKDVTSENLLVDVRTLEEFNKQNLNCINIPVMNRQQHLFLHRHKKIALVIVVYGLIINSVKIFRDLKKVTNDKTLIFYCSKGRLRSPVMYLTYKILFRNRVCKILKGGIRSVLEVDIIEI